MKERAKEKDKGESLRKVLRNKRWCIFSDGEITQESRYHPFKIPDVVSETMRDRDKDFYY